MKTFVALCVVLAAGYVHSGVVPATTFVRAPSFDSAIIKSDRLGGNFAYSTVEGHAYAAVSPIVQRVTEPVGVSYTAHQVNLGHVATPVAVSQPIYAQHTISQQLLSAPAVVSSPIYGGIASAPIYGGVVGAPVFGGVAGAPVFGGVAGAPVGGIASAPAVQNNPAPTPVQGTVVDADTVAVESA